VAAVRAQPGGHVLDLRLPHAPADGLRHHLPLRLGPGPDPGGGGGGPAGGAGSAHAAGPGPHPPEAAGTGPGQRRRPLAPGRDRGPAGAGRRRRLRPQGEHLPGGPGPDGRPGGAAGQPGGADRPGRTRTPLAAGAGGKPRTHPLRQLRGLPAARPAWPQPAEHGPVQRRDGERGVPGERQVPAPGGDPAAQMDLPHGAGAAAAGGGLPAGGAAAGPGLCRLRDRLPGLVPAAGGGAHPGHRLLHDPGLRPGRLRPDQRNLRGPGQRLLLPHDAAVRGLLHPGFGAPLDPDGGPGAAHVALPQDPARGVQ